MCGITGFLNPPDGRFSASYDDTVRAMSDALRHRGPDRGAIWSDAKQGIAFGHRRLSIVDLSEAGNQPMESSCGRFVICYNGETYNAAELRRELLQKGKVFRGQSDTEVILEGFSVWGIAPTIKRATGMFALALWDRKLQTLYLVRDRIGIKPLYWGFSNGSLLFTSELQALKVFPGFSPSLNPAAIDSLLRYAYITAPLSIYNGFHKLEPGTILSLKTGGEPQITPFWSLEEIVQTSRSNGSAMNLEEAEELFETLLADAVKGRMIADVPLGTFLSGGIDSSLITALAQENSSQPVRTFSIGFSDDKFDEAHHAKRVANHLGTHHTELYMGEADLLATVPEIVAHYDEPFADSSQIPTYALCQLTRGEVTVALSGDGGDEIFAGYNRYLWADRIDGVRKHVPSLVRRGIAGLAQTIPASCYDRLAAPFVRTMAGQVVGYRAHKLADTIAAETPDDVYRRLVTHWRDLGTGNHAVPTAYITVPALLDTHTEERMQYLDTLTYLPDDILTKVDRASMAHALEVRVPLLDHRVVEASWRLAFDAKLHNGTGKRLLRNLLAKRFPERFFDRPKMGFGVPLDRWLKHPLKPWADAIIHDTDWHGTFGLETNRIHAIWSTYLSGKVYSPYQIWCLLALGAWHSAHR